ncbi:conserved hypothetical protein [Solidesulfovibrio fructosivorans JJ]]|uniref:Uncharacterized protein n=1 Tax=Solidesulfovibrio fructosivorans JJ] TaxID=596151 RepID=E1JVL9_SOLFR|nr:hypothetical protein [Solidesulfovibrio fructosivorans]EFL51507.1 conserved hypothetical protein [Solidesulfovibrio fructosivorans JJ]]
MLSQASISSRRQAGAWAKRFFGPSRLHPDTPDGREAAAFTPPKSPAPQKTGEIK